MFLKKKKVQYGARAFARKLHRRSGVFSHLLVQNILDQTKKDNTAYIFIKTKHVTKTCIKIVQTNDF